MNEPLFYSSLLKDYNIKWNLSYWRPEKVVWLNHLIIPKQHRGKLIGSRLMQEFTKWLDANQYDSRLLVSNCYGTPENILIEFYKKFGYNIEKNKTKNIYMLRKYENGSI